MSDTHTEPAGGENPAVLGLLSHGVGGTALGLSLLGYVSATAQGGSIMPIVLAATGLCLLLATVWAMRLGQTFLATVLGAFAGFWLSYAVLVLGLAHNWFAIPASEVSHTVAQFLIAWAVVVVALGIASIRLPLVFTMILGTALVAVCLMIAATLNGSVPLTRAAGAFILMSAALGLYTHLGTAMESLGAKGLPLGTPLIDLRLSGQTGAATANPSLSDVG